MEEHKRHFPQCPFLRGEYCGNMPIEIDPDINSEKSCHFTSATQSQTSSDPNEAEKLAAANNYNKSDIPRYPLFSEPSNRSRSFLSPNWKSPDIDCNRLIDSGFFYTGKQFIYLFSMNFSY